MSKFHVLNNPSLSCTSGQLLVNDELPFCVLSRNRTELWRCNHRNWTPKNRLPALILILTVPTEHYKECSYGWGLEIRNVQYNNTHSALIWSQMSRSDGIKCATIKIFFCWIWFIASSSKNWKHHFNTDTTNTESFQAANNKTKQNKAKNILCKFRKSINMPILILTWIFTNFAISTNIS